MIEALVLARRPRDARATAERLAEKRSEARSARTRAARTRSRRDGPRSCRRRGRSGGGRRDPARAVASWRCRPTPSTGSRSRSDTPGGIERLFQVKRRPPDKGIMLLLDDAAQAATIGIDDAGGHGARRGVLAGRADPGRPAAARCPAARRRSPVAPPTIGLRVPDHAAPRALAAAVGPLPTTSANRSGLPEARDAAGDPRSSSATRRPHPRRRTGAWRPGVHGRRLQRRAAPDPPRRGGTDGPHRRHPGRGRYRADAPRRRHRPVA